MLMCGQDRDAGILCRKETRWICDCGNIPVECNTYISDRISKRSTLVFDDDGRVQKLQVLF